MVHQARGCACRPQPDAPLAVLSPQMTEGRHCQVCLLDDRRLELLVQVGVATAHPASLCEPRGLCSVCWLICASEPVTQDCLRGLQSQYLPVLKSNYSLVTGFRNVWIPVSALTLSSCLTLGKWLNLFELPLVGQSLTIMLPRKGFFLDYYFWLCLVFVATWALLGAKQGPLFRCGVRASHCDEKLLMASLVAEHEL